MATAKKKTTDAKPAYTFESKPLMDIVNTLLSGAISSDLDVTVSQFAPSSQALFQKCGMELTDVVLRYQFDEERGQGYLTRPQVAQGVGQFADTVVFATPTFMAPLSEVMGNLGALDSTLDESVLKLNTDDQEQLEVYIRYPRDTQKEQKHDPKKMLKNPQDLEQYGGTRISQVPEGAEDIGDGLYVLPGEGLTYQVLSMRPEFIKHADIPDGTYAVQAAYRKQAQKKDGTTFTAESIIIMGENGYYDTSAGRVKNTLTLLIPGGAFEKITRDLGTVEFAGKRMKNYTASVEVKKELEAQLLA